MKNTNFYMFWRGWYASTAIEIAVEMNEDMAVLDDQGIWRRRTTQLNFDVLQQQVAGSIHQEKILDS